MKLPKAHREILNKQMLQAAADLLDSLIYKEKRPLNRNTMERVFNLKRVVMLLKGEGL